MKIIWKVSSKDVLRVKKFYDLNCDNEFVKKRIERNVEGIYPKVTKSEFTKRMIACLLTTQQRSGPKNPVGRFIHTKPVPLNYSKCKKYKNNLQNFIQKEITEFGGIRRANSIAKEVNENFTLLENGVWNKVFEFINDLESNRTAQQEREAAEYIRGNFKGFGPKQSRNLWQSLGITQHEIPIDSRITKWLNNFGFPLVLTANALSDRNYYDFVSDGFQHLSKAAGILPCVLDAVIFSSYDGDSWTEKNTVW